MIDLFGGEYHGACGPCGTISQRRKGKKEIEEQKVKPPIPIRAIDALIEDEEQNAKQKKRTKRKKQGTGPQPSYPGSSGRLLRPAVIIR